MGHKIEASPVKLRRVPRIAPVQLIATCAVFGKSCTHILSSGGSTIGANLLSKNRGILASRWPHRCARFPQIRGAPSANSEESAQNSTLPRCLTKSNIGFITMRKVCGEFINGVICGSRMMCGAIAHGEFFARPRIECLRRHAVDRRLPPAGGPRLA